MHEIHNCLSVFICVGAHIYILCVGEELKTWTLCVPEHRDRKCAGIYTDKDLCMCVCVCMCVYIVENERACIP